MKRRRMQFRLRTILLAMPIVCAMLSIGVSAFHRSLEYRQAWFDLAALDMGSTIGAEVKFHSRRRVWSDGDVAELLRIIRTLQRRQNFGISPGVKVAVVDFAGSRISEDSLEKLRQTLPDTKVRP